MITVNVVCVGKIKEGFYRDAIAEYSKRISRFAKFNIIEVAEFQSAAQSEGEIAQVKDQEGKRILTKTKGCIVALDLSGESISSEGLADLIEGCAVNGQSEISFVIGGSVGLSSQVVCAAERKIAFGKITFPHQLMRVVLAEQIYRAFMINEGNPYHK